MSKHTLMDVMSVKRDAANARRRNRRAAAKKASPKRLAAARQAIADSKIKRKAARSVPSESDKPLGHSVTAITNASAARKALDAAICGRAAPVKVTVKQAGLDVCYADEERVFSTQDAIATIQAVHPGMNESSIRVWISDFRKDGSIELVKKDGRQALLKAGKLGKFALR
jgi:hypothetical protein